MGPSGAEVIEVATLSPDKQRWTDDALYARLAAADATSGDRVIAIDAPLTQTACARCTLAVCPGADACEVPAVAWLRTTGRALVQQVAAAAETAGASKASISRVHLTAQARLAPYAHRMTDVITTYERGLLPISQLGAANSAITARARHLKKRLAGVGYTLHENLLEVSPAATVTALCGPRVARGYKHDADPWRTRAVILEELHDLSFAPQSRMAREEVLGNDHCFDAVISAYSAYRWVKDGCPAPDPMFAEDGWIYAPDTSA